jgi:hypothetical protein
MRRACFILAAAAVLAVWALAPLAAQDLNSEIEMIRSMHQSERQAIVAKNLTLTEAQSQVFWPMYREYRTEMARLGDRAVNLLMNYAKNYETLTNEQAKTMLDEFLAIQKDELGVKTKWLPKFRKSLPEKTVVRFYQIENKLDLLVRMPSIDEVPLVLSETTGGTMP